MNEHSGLIVHFPFMRYELVPESLRRFGMFINPGLYEQTEDSFKPKDLPLDPIQARNFLNLSFEFGEQFKKPSDMVYFGARKPDDFYSQSTMSIRWQLSTYGLRDKDSDASGGLLKAQHLLLLEYVFQEKMVELKSIDSRIEASRKDFDEALGIEREDRPGYFPEPFTLSTKITGTNWKKVLWAFALFLPPEAFLLIYDEYMAEEMEEAGVVWEKAENEKIFPGNLLDITFYRGTLPKQVNDIYLGYLQNDLNFLKIGPRPA